MKNSDNKSLTILMYVAVVALIVFAVFEVDRQRKLQDQRRRLEMYCIHADFIPKICVSILPSEDRK